MNPLDHFNHARLILKIREIMSLTIESDIMSLDDFIKVTDGALTYRSDVPSDILVESYHYLLKNKLGVKKSIDYLVENGVCEFKNEGPA